MNHLLTKEQQYLTYIFHMKNHLGKQICILKLLLKGQKLQKIKSSKDVKYQQKSKIDKSIEHRFKSAAQTTDNCILLNKMQKIKEVSSTQRVPKKQLKEQNKYLSPQIKKEPKQYFSSQKVKKIKLDEILKISKFNQTVKPYSIRSNKVFTPKYHKKINIDSRILLQTSQKCHRTLPHKNYPNIAKPNKCQTKRNWKNQFKWGDFTGWNYFNAEEQLIFK